MPAGGKPYPFVSPRSGTVPGAGTLKLIAGASTGSAADLLARSIGEQLSSDLRVPVIVENRAGASGLLAAQTVLAAPADGMTVLVHSNSFVINPFVMPVQFDSLRDFSGVAQLGSMPHLLVVPTTSHTDRQPSSLRGRRRGALPSRLPESEVPRISREKLLMATGMNSVHVPFKNAGDALRRPCRDRSTGWWRRRSAW